MPAGYREGEGPCRAGSFCTRCSGSAGALPSLLKQPGIHMNALAVRRPRVNSRIAAVPVLVMLVSCCVAQAQESVLVEQTTSAQKAQKRLADGEAPSAEPLRVPPKGIVERRSTSIMAVQDGRVASAIRFIWDHLDASLLVDNVAAYVGVSRSTLERAFWRCLGGVYLEMV